MIRRSIGVREYGLRHAGRAWDVVRPDGLILATVEDRHEAETWVRHLNAAWKDGYAAGSAARGDVAELGEG